MIDNEVKSILFAGVGGQGILRASDIICEAIMEAGLDVKKGAVMVFALQTGLSLEVKLKGTSQYVGGILVIAICT